MIESLRIEGIAIVDQAELEFGPGLNVLTGETGAGKSIVLGALSLLSGARASAGTLREGVEQGAVEAVFCTRALPGFETELETRGFDLEGDGSHELVVRRTLAGSGRSRARLQGQMVPVSLLSELFAGRIEISSQHSSQALLRTESHGLFLDTAGGLLPLRKRIAQLYDELRALDAELEKLQSETEERERQRDFLAFQLSEIDEVGLQPGEFEGLGQEHGRLAHADRLSAEGAGAVIAVAGDASGGDAAGAVDLLAHALRALEGLQEADSSLAGLVERFAALDAELRDAATDLERYVAGVEQDPARLATVEERLAQVERLRRKYGNDESEIFAYRDGIEAELASLEGADERGGLLAAEREERVAALAETASRLSKGRAKAARKLCRTLEAGLRDLALTGARIEVDLRSWQGDARPQLPCGPTGAEIPEFQFSANKGERPRSLQRVASGGELSRVFLALKNALRGAATGMVLVFDEVDAGVGGRVAERIGRALSELAQDHQVLCITHLPQIAVFADVHFRVRKDEQGGRTLAQIQRIEGDARVDEIARMAGGETVTEVTREHARDLLKAKAL